MMQRYSYDNPEYAFHYRRIQTVRTTNRLRGQLLLFGSGAVAAEALTLVLTHLSNIGPYVVTLVILLSIIGFGLFVSLSSLRTGYLPISNEEVDQQRRREREQLFSYAQGVVPWWYRRTTIALLFLYSLFLTCLGIGYFLYVLTHYNGLQGFLQISTSASVFGILFVSAGVYYFVQTLRRARTARRLVRLSSRELALRMSLGEGNYL